ncbi:patatin-like phospholipase family protein [Paraliobacillus ryukyuensis]|uniref:patatin-like phospholipase family protein n=1 Tax=Paraliobacillus ryukyuensis TaxID=200904 RepID=UPI0009A83FD3|nr:patatin-like phospholipase family protein [Paraliobacillus ryukyuensis]
MKIDGAFSGGGVKAFAYMGALEVLEEKGFEFVRVAGSSAGAIVAGFLAAGYSNKDIQKIFMDVDLKEFMDNSLLEKYIPIIKWLSLYFTMGLYKGKRFEDWLYSMLGQKQVYTFGDIPADRLKVIVADLSLGKIVVIPDDLERIYHLSPENFSVAKAIRMSASLPYFFRPEKLLNRDNEKSIIVDGGVLSNLPLWLFEQKKSKRVRPLLGMKLTAPADQIPPKQITNALDLTKDLINTMRIAHDNRYISQRYQGDILFLPVTHVKVSALNVSMEEKKHLVAFGRERTEAFLKKWSK